MEETEEVAIALLPAYRAMLEAKGRARSMASVKQFAIDQMSAYESNNVMDQVTAHLMKLVFPDSTPE